MPTILFQDDHLIAVHKPSGQFVHATDLNRMDGIPLLQQVRDLIRAFVYPIHRLDRGTSGIVLFGKSPDAAAAMNRLFRERQVSKQYLALVRGFCPNVIIDRPLKRKGMTRRKTSGTYQDAATAVECLNHFDVPLPSGPFMTTRCSLVRATPRTGRFHQIRRHLNGISHPVLGDSSHGDTRQNQFFRESFGLTRLMLAATRLEFTHPSTGADVLINCNASADYQLVLNRLQPNNQ